jgi:hypothetical protein
MMWLLSARADASGKIPRIMLDPGLKACIEQHASVESMFEVKVPASIGD